MAVKRLSLAIFNNEMKIRKRKKMNMREKNVERQSHIHQVGWIRETVETE